MKTPERYIEELERSKKELAQLLREWHAEMSAERMSEELCLQEVERLFRQHEMSKRN